MVMDPLDGNKIHHYQQNLNGILLVKSNTNNVVEMMTVSSLPSYKAAVILKRQKISSFSLSFGVKCFRKYLNLHNLNSVKHNNSIYNSFGC
jgi:hypothetical protein